ncbi:MAG: hypothetical protein ABI629_12185 [bacterium]
MLLMRINRPLLAAALGMALALPGLALAGPGHRVADACRQDVSTLCPDADSGCDAKQCLREHSSQLSTGCSEAIQERKQEHAAVRAACEADVGRLCPTADSPRDARKCLRENREQLSAGCGEALQALKPARDGATHG